MSEAASSGEALGRRQAMKDRLLEAALPHAAFDGWSRRTLLAAAADAGLDRGTATRLFPDAGHGLVDWLEDWADRRMLAAVPAEELARLPVRRRVLRLARARLEALAEDKEAVRRAAVAQSLPQNLAGARRALWRTVDRIREAAGLGQGENEGWRDVLSRASLAAVLLATYLVWLEDHSPDHAESCAFLERRLDNTLRLARAPRRVGTLLPGLNTRPPPVEGEL